MESLDIFSFFNQRLLVVVLTIEDFSDTLSVVTELFSTIL